MEVKQLPREGYIIEFPFDPLVGTPVIASIIPYTDSDYACINNPKKKFCPLSKDCPVKTILISRRGWKILFKKYENKEDWHAKTHNTGLFLNDQFPKSQYPMNMYFN